MEWTLQFQLFLFDFDGLLVDTERLHYQAYVQVLAERGFALDWDFLQFCAAAHLHATALKEAFYAKWPNLDPDWDQLYADKKRAYLDQIEAGALTLMPGVSSLLTLLEQRQIRRCVVTHSPLAQIERISAKLPLLRTIPHWITRDQYEQPKPHPECYRKAIALYSAPGDRIVGFEDSVRGWQALRQTPAEPILICSPDHPLLPSALAQGATHYPSFLDIGLASRIALEEGR